MKSEHHPIASPKARAIQPVILSGGAGSRLWPLSRTLNPKQFLPLMSQYTLLQETLRRLPQSLSLLPPIFVCNGEHRFLIAEQVRALGLASGAIILEPEARNTAPAIALALQQVMGEDAERLLLVLPTDHHIENTAAFHAAITEAAAAADAGYLVTFGITPTHADTGFGYIRRGAGLEGLANAFAVAEFIEKPQAAVAEQFVQAGTHLWNSGMFMLRADTLRDAFLHHAPEILEAATASLNAAQRDLDFLRPDAAAFAQAPSISFDYAVMERARNAALIPCQLGWSDLGSWDALWSLAEKDMGGNATEGDAVLLNCKNCYVRGSDNRVMALSDVEDLIVVDTPDALLIARRGQSQHVKELVAALKPEHEAVTTTHKMVYRPWGHYQILHDGSRFQVKEISVKPGGKLSLQKHFHRAEHWVIVNGSALVTRNHEEILLGENESVYLPLGCVHRLENPGRVTLRLIEVQSGSYLGEDDIVRLEDSYGRAPR